MPLGTKRKQVLPLLNRGLAFEGLLSSFSVPKAVVERETLIGGVGKTLRWTLRNGPFKERAPTIIYLIRVVDVAATLEAVKQLDPSVAVMQGGVENLSDEVDDDGLALGNCMRLRVSDHWLVHTVFASLREVAPMELRFENDAIDNVIEVGVERMDRTDFTFWNQSTHTAAPKQSWYKWLFSFLPDDWSELPFTWARLACNVSGPLERLPLPLRGHVAARKLQEGGAQLEAMLAQPGQTTDAEVRVLRARIERWKRHIPAQHQVTAALSHLQSRQLIAAHYICRFHAEDRGGAALLREAKEVLRLYVLHGYNGRLFGPYKQNAEFVGHGRLCRSFRKLPQYHVSNLRTSVLNVIYQMDGSYRGRGQRLPRNKEQRSRPRRMSNDTQYKYAIRKSLS